VAGGTVVLVTYMLVGGPVLQGAPTLAMIAALAKLRVERLQGLDIKPPDLKPAKERPDVLADLPLVAASGARLDIDHLKPAMNQLVDRRGRSRVALLVDPVQQPCPHLLRFLLRSRTLLDGLTQVVTLLGHRVDAGIDADAVAAARQGLDVPSLTVVCPSHNSIVATGLCHE
jgi:hypothetical protein